MTTLFHAPVTRNGRFEPKLGDGDNFPMTMRHNGMVWSVLAQAYRGRACRLR